MADVFAPPPPAPAEGWAAWYRNATPEQKAERRAAMFKEQAEHDAIRAEQEAEYQAKRTYALSDEGLRASIEHGDLGLPYGFHPRQAEALLTIPVEHRDRADHEARTRGNLQGGVPSSVLWAVVADVNRRIADGTVDQEWWAEGVARRHREAEAAANVGNRGERVIVYPSEMRRA